jgi:hypothetical protein
MVTATFAEKYLKEVLELMNFSYLDHKYHKHADDKDNKDCSFFEKKKKRPAK